MNKFVSLLFIWALLFSATAPAQTIAITSNGSFSYSPPPVSFSVNVPPNCPACPVVTNCLPCPPPTVIGTNVYVYVTNAPPPVVTNGLSAPFNVTTTGATSNSISTHWQSSGIVDGFFVQWATTATGPWNQEGQVGSNIFTYTDEVSLLPGTTYYHHVLAFSGTNISPPSAAAVGVTLPVAPPVTNNPATVFNETYGPFASWTNATAFGAKCDGATDDTAALNKALAAIGLNGCSPVLYIPGRCKITGTLTLQGRENVWIKGASQLTSGFIWAGASGATIGDASTMFHVDAVDTCYFENLTFDGGGKSFTIINHSQTGSSPFDNANTWTDCAFVNGASGAIGVAGGLYGSGFSNEGFLRCVVTNMGIGVKTLNYNAIDGWFTGCYFANVNIGLLMQPGSLHAYQTGFANNGTDVFLNTANNFTSLAGNISYHSYSFFTVVNSGNATPLLIKGNTVIDPTGQPLTIASQGPVVVMDNTLAYAGGPAIAFTYGSPVYATVLGNTNCFGTLFTMSAGGNTNVVDNVSVARSTLTFAPPAMPVEATNLNRVVIEIPRSFTAASLQTAINVAPDGSVIHIPFCLPNAPYGINQTVTIPAGKDIRLVGDGGQTKAYWTGPAGQPMFLLPYPSHATFSHLQLYGGNGPIVQVAGIGATAARVYLRDSISLSATKANLDLGDCPNTVVDWRGNNECYSQTAGSAGLLLEGRGTVKFIETDSSQNTIDLVVTNGGNLYVETSYNESGNQFLKFRDLLGSGNSTITLLSGIHHEQSNPTGNGGDGFFPNGGTTNAFALTNFSGQFTLSLIGGISDWLHLTGTQTGNIWLQGNTTFNAPVKTWPILNGTSFIPVQSQNLNYNSGSGGGFTAFPDVGSASAAYTRAMFAPARSTYSDITPMTRRTNQTDVLLEDVLLQKGTVNLLITP